MPTYYDIHCHLFNKDILKPRLVDLLIPLFELIGPNVLNSEANMVRVIRRLKRTVDILKQPTSGVFDHIDEAYDHELVLTPLMFDLNFADDNDSTWMQDAAHTLRQQVAMDLIEKIANFVIDRAGLNVELMEAIQTGDGKNIFDELNLENGDVFSSANYQQQIDDLEALATDSNRKTRVRPFFGVDPRRYESEEELIAKVREKCLDDGALWAGGKLYAPAGFSPTDKLLYGSEHERGGLYAFCEENDIPITVHCSATGFATVAREVVLNGHVNRKVGNAEDIAYYDNRNYRFASDFLSINPGPAEAIRERARAINHPKLWNLVLKRFPNLRLNLAHLGNSSEIMAYLNREIPFISLTPDEFYNLHSRFDGEEQDLVKSYFDEEDGRWKLNIPHTASEGESAEACEKRKRLWDVLESKGRIDNWTQAILNILHNPDYTNVYTDLSCFTEFDPEDENESISPALSRVKAELYDQLDDRVKQRILYGSDFWLNVMQGPAMRQYFLDFKNVFGDDFEDIASRNPERFLGVG